MAQTYGLLNQLFLRFTNESLKTFPEIKGLAEEAKWALDQMEKNPVGMDIYQALRPDMGSIAEQIHLQKEEVFEMDVPFLKHLFAKEIYSRLMDDEKDIFWQSLKNILKQMGIAQSCGTCIPTIEGLLKTFQEKNPKIDMKSPGIHGLMMKQLMTDPNIGKSIGNMFASQDEETNPLANIPDKLKALGLTTLSNPNIQIEVEEEEEEEETKEEETKNEAKTEEPISASDVFSQTKKNRRKHKKTNTNKNVFATVADMMSKKNIDSPDFADLQKQVAGFFDGSSTNNAEIQQMMEQFTTNGSFSGINPQEIMDSFKSGMGMEDIMKNMHL